MIKYFPILQKYNLINGQQQETGRSSTFRSEGLQSSNLENRIQIDPQIEIVIKKIWNQDSLLKCKLSSQGQYRAQKKSNKPDI